jgi:hypothetical protein
MTRTVLVVSLFARQANQSLFAVIHNPPPCGAKGNPLMAGQLDDGNAFFQEWPDPLKTFPGTCSLSLRQASEKRRIGILPLLHHILHRLCGANHLICDATCMLTSTTNRAN